MSGARIIAIFSLAVLASCTQKPAGTYSDISNATGANAMGAAPSAEVGRIDRLPLTQIPMPPGNWIEFAKAEGVFAFAGQPTHIAMFGLVEKNQINSLLFVETNLGQWGTGFAPNQQCLNGYVPPGGPITDVEFYLRDPHGVNNDDFDCVAIYSFEFRPSGNSAFFFEWYEAAKKYGGIPKRVVAASTNVSRNKNYVNYMIFHFPERDGIANGSWHVGTEGAAERSYIASLVARTQRIRPLIVQGAKGEL